MDRPDCYKCQHRETVPGSCHSRCRHPAFNAANAHPLGELLALLGKRLVARALSEAITVMGHPQGIKNGWFNHPFNFDPVWLVECTGFEPKEA